MKKNKIIGIIVASLGVIVSMAGAAALYTKAATDATFNIGAGQFQGSTGTVTYQINGSVSGSVAPTYLSHDGNHEGTGLVYVEQANHSMDEAQTIDQVKYVFELGATYASPLVQQEIVTGELILSITNIPEAYRGKLSIYAAIDGYVENSLGAEHYSKVSQVNDTPDYAITAEHPSFSFDSDVAVSTNRTQKLVVFMKYDLSTFDVLNQDEAGLGYSLSVTWKKASDGFVPAYVVGDGNQWTKDDEFVMAPNINSTTGWEWYYNGLSGTLGNAKCLKGDPALAESWSGGNNVLLNSNNTYNVVWSGSHNDAAQFQLA